jgi:SAM-dependent methyltransferase
MPSFARRLRGSAQPLLWHAFAGAQQQRAREPSYGARYDRIVDVLERQRARPDERVLELGCGTGEGVIALAERGFVVVGIDAAPGMVRRARAQLALRGGRSATVRRMNFNRPLPFGNAAFDHAVCVSALQLAVEPARVVAELIRVVRPGGVILLATPVPGRTPTRLPPTGSRRHRVLYIAKAVIERTGLVPRFDGQQLAALLRDAGATIVETHMTDGLILAAGHRMTGV